MPDEKFISNQRIHLKAANSPGGVAPHARVQVRDSRQVWHLHASFSNTAQARDCAEQLDERGISARVVESRCCPTAG